MAKEEVEGTEPNREYIKADDPVWQEHLKTAKCRNLLIPIMAGIIIYMGTAVIAVMLTAVRGGC